MAEREKAMRQSGYMKRQQAAVEVIKEATRRFAVQQSKDIALIAAHEAFGAGPERLKRFSDVFDRLFLEYADMVMDDAKGDRKVVYTKAKIDEILQSICGPYFDPWEERYQ